MTSLEAVCAPYRALAIAGTAKNAGKTTVLNHLIEAFAASGERLGLSSIGRDGEAVDQVTNRPKPRIRPPVGALVATSHESALYSQASLEAVASTPYRTALGPVSIYRVESPGFVEVAGPVKVKEASALLTQLGELGCTKMLLDGAADRRSFISCGVDGFVLATGLALASDPKEVLAETLSVLSRLQLPAPVSAWRAVCEQAGRPGAIQGGEFVPWPQESFLSGLEGFGSWLPSDASALYVPGAFTDLLGEAVLRRRSALPLILPAGTHLLVSRAVMERLASRGCRFYALRPLKAVALTLNPTSPDGVKEDPGAFLKTFQQALPDLPVFDVEIAKH